MSRTGTILLALGVAALAPESAAPKRHEAYEQTTLIYPPFRHCLGIHRATAVQLFVYVGTRTRFNEPTGIVAVKLARKDDPDTAEDDDELTVFGLNSGECEIVYNTSLYSVKIFGEPGDGPGQFREPLGITADEGGNVFVADTGNDRIVRLAYTDDELVFAGAFGSQGSRLGQFSSPSQIALGVSKTLYISDTGNDRIVVTAFDGQPLREIGGSDGLELDSPFGLAVVEATDPWIAGRREMLVVSDSGARRLSKFSLEGEALVSVGADELPITDASFDYLAIDYYGSVYATDRGNSMIHKFDAQLEYITSFGRHGSGKGELDEPRGITIWRRFGQLFVTERAGAQYFWMGTEIEKLSAEPAIIAPPSRDLTLTYFLTETSRVTVDVLDGGGNLLDRLVKNRRRATGGNIERLHLSAGPDGGPLPPGAYLVRVTARPTYSSRKYFHDTAEIEVKVAPGGD